MKRIFVSFLQLILICSAALAQDAAKLSFIATDDASNAIGDLKKEEIALLIDGKPQVVTSFEKQETPLIYVLAVDCSGSMRLILDEIVSSAKTIVNQNRKDDEALIFSFTSSDKIKGMQAFSTDKNILTRTIDNFYIEGGATALIDALYVAVKKVSEHKKDGGGKYRRVVFAITDGEDRDSFYTAQQLYDLIQKENVQIFLVGLTNNLAKDGGYMGKSPRAKAKDFIEKIVAVSGGAAIFPKEIKDTPDAAAQLVPLSQSQYVIGYTPSTDTKQKAQKIEIKLAKDSKRKDVKFYFRSEVK
jgi:VWFA-related protein